MLKQGISGRSGVKFQLHLKLWNLKQPPETPFIFYLHFQQSWLSHDVVTGLNKITHVRHLPKSLAYIWHSVNGYYYYYWYQHGWWLRSSDWKSTFLLVETLSHRTWGEEILRQWVSLHLTLHDLMKPQLYFSGWVRHKPKSLFPAAARFTLETNSILGN